MEESRTFYPPKRTGTLLQIFLILIFSSGGVWGIWGISNVQVALELLPYLALIVLFLASVPFLIYRLYALHRSFYTLERGGISLQWGWRSENIPMDQVKWVHRLEDLETAPQPPVLRWPGSVIGTRRFQRGPEVEYLASMNSGLVLIAAGSKYYAISPFSVSDFLSTYQDLTELGTIFALPTESIRPTLILSELSANKPILGMFLAGLVLNISMLIWTLLVIPGRETVSLGFTPAGVPHEALESVRLILFPIINTTAYLGNLFLGLFLFRNPENRFLAYILWGGSVLIALLFHIGMAFIL